MHLGTELIQNKENYLQCYSIINEKCLGSKTLKEKSVEVLVVSSNRTSAFR